MNFSTENLVFLLIGTVLSVPIGFFVNAYTPKIQNWLARRSYKKAVARIQLLETELKQTTKYVEKKEDLILLALENLFNMIALFCFLLLMLVSALAIVFIRKNPFDIPILSMIAVLLFVFLLIMPVLYYSISTWHEIQSARNFEKFSEEKKKEIEKLSQVKPEDQKESAS